MTLLTWLWVCTGRDEFFLRRRGKARNLMVLSFTIKRTEGAAIIGVGRL